jgi:phenylpyruvate tautomerase PptA (4-oxalocrotonate tautomerase family)
LTIEGHDRNDIWVNILNAPDGGWGVGGTAHTGDELVAAVVREAQS